MALVSSLPAHCGVSSTPFPVLAFRVLVYTREKLGKILTVANRFTRIGVCRVGSTNLARLPAAKEVLSTV